MRGLNLDQLRALEAVVTLGSFTAAARQLNLSQSAVSTQISELERRFGVRLVERLGKKAFGTSAGREVIERGQFIAREAEAVEAAMRRHREGWLGRVRVAASTTALIYHLPPVLRRLRVEHPNLELIVTTGTTTQVVERILRNDIDVGIVSLPINQRDLEVVPLRQEALVAIFPSGIGDIPAKATPKSLGQYPLILEYARAQVRMLIHDWLSANGSELHPAMEVDNLEAVKRMVMAGLGVSIVPAMVVTGKEATADIVVRPLRPALTRTLAYVQRRDKLGEPALQIVRAELMKMK
jgi:DNA-binding transcriptional LysR family regulator